MNKLIKIFLMIIFALAISCSNEGTTGGGGDDYVEGYTHSNHPPAGDYHSALDTNTIRNTITHNGDGTCTITGTATSYSVLIDNKNPTTNYSITVTSWYTYNSEPNVNEAMSNAVVGTRGEATITQPSGVSYFSVTYNTTNNTVLVNFAANSIDYNNSIYLEYKK
ncbi:hypothetical protein [Brachyspira catarrhinii]|uniref:Lipocalin-like domain-containing protein n=1 Tax=Brachyspira catarrhinii TaxID=2528966 RepID=A0ABY2TMZ7_9SPIR|nr:hypothetical protein [Brachyspira catarrhinii]TKZ29107.1 hypothetical protein EZH24_11240 [Brachyspira catarrhinii]